MPSLQSDLENGMQRWLGAALALVLTGAAAWCATAFTPVGSNNVPLFTPTNPGYVFNPTTPVTTAVGNYTLASTDCGTVIRAGTGSTGQFSVALPAASGFPAGCLITVRNADFINGKSLAGFPADVYPMLYPQQAVSVQQQGGAWGTIYNPGPWNVLRPMFFVSTTGNDSNDCISLATACSTIQHAADIACYRVNSVGAPPGISLAPGTYFGFQVISDCTGSNSLEVTGNPASPSTVILQGASVGGYIVYAKDKGSIVLNGVTLDGVFSNSAGGVGCGQGSVLDVANVVFGSFPFGVDIFTTDFCKINQTGPLYITKSALAFVQADPGGQVGLMGSTVNISGGVTLNYVWLASTAYIIGGTTFTGSAPTTTINTCLAQANGVISKNGTVVPGSQLCNQATSTATGGQVP